MTEVRDNITWALNDVVRWGRRLPLTRKMVHVRPAVLRSPFATGAERIDSRKHLAGPLVAIAWIEARPVAMGVRYVCGESTTSGRDASSMDDARLCDRCVLASEGFQVYRYYDADGLPVYIGCTSQPLPRMAQHQRASAWWPEVAEVRTEYFANQAEALAAEANAILTEQPRHNVRGLLGSVA